MPRGGRGGFSGENISRVEWVRRVIARDRVEAREGGITHFVV